MFFACMCPLLITYGRYDSILDFFSSVEKVNFEKYQNTANNWHYIPARKELSRGNASVKERIKSSMLRSDCL